eukprot:NODE_437_length_1745_cov_105.254127_g368_i0.p1 GENE.NODE_437_length_1745_cov_105.254127_g368_i0~~NODE_437_length_1745_cov_105.254127_g368_i0.p1  ORF type:complete len:543 (+),score=174.78 NODE_437_length_1745_cov_105.254127_g368_i0:24-1631(+)
MGEFKIERASTQGVDWTLVICGGFMVIIGFLIYYLFPLSLLSFNIMLLFYMFFGLLMCMLLGLVLLALNLESILEHFLSVALFFWENSAIRTLILKNLVAHRKRNRKTTIMYALSLAFIIFISVSFDLQIETYRYNVMRWYGTPMRVRKGTGELTMKVARELEKVAIADPDIEDFAWLTQEAVGGAIKSGFITTLGRYRQANLYIRACSPNFYSVVDTRFLVVREQDKSSGLSISEQLYTDEGTHSMPLGSTYIEYLDLHSLDSKFMLVLALKNVSESSGQPSGNDVNFNTDIYQVWKPTAFLDTSPSVFFSKFPRRVNQHSIIAMSTYVNLRGEEEHGMESLKFDRMLVKTRSGTPANRRSNIENNLKDAIRRAGGNPDKFDVQDAEKAVEPVVQAKAIVQAFFTITTMFAMLMCFFSLTSSMFTNIHEQSKEIGILRALGINRFPLIRLYVWEAIILVLSATIMGFLIGTAIAWTMGIQRMLFTQLPLPFNFPWSFFGQIIFSAFLCAFFASFFPTMRMVRQPVVHILRRLLT